MMNFGQQLCSTLYPRPRQPVDTVTYRVRLNLAIEVKKKVCLGVDFGIAGASGDGLPKSSSEPPRDNLILKELKIVIMVSLCASTDTG